MIFKVFLRICRGPRRKFPANLPQEEVAAKPLVFINMKKRLDIEDNPVAIRLAEISLYQRLQREFGLYAGKISKWAWEYAERSLLRPTDVMEEVARVAKEVFETRTGEILLLVQGKVASIRRYDDGMHKEVEKLLMLDRPTLIATQLMQDQGMTDLSAKDIAECVQLLGRKILEETMNKSIEIVRDKESGKS